MNILCAEDHEQTAQLVRVFVQRAGHCVTTVNDGYQAWSQLEVSPERFDAVITDQHMPSMTGIELIQRLRSTRYTGKIIVLSAALQPEDEAALTELAVDAILFKPGGLTRLVPTLEARARSTSANAEMRAR